MIMLSQTPDLNDFIWERLYTEYQQDEQFRESIQNSVKRILRIKLLYLQKEWRVPLTIDPLQVYKDINENKEDVFFQEQAARGVTLIRDVAIPFKNSKNESVLIVGQDKEFIQVGKKYYPNAEQYYFDYDPFYEADKMVISDIKKLLIQYDWVIFNLVNPNSLEVLKSIKEYQSKIIVFSTLTPIYLQEVPWVESAIAVYGWDTESLEAGFSALYGDIPFKGKLPIIME